MRSSTRVTLFDLSRDTAWVETVQDSVWRIEIRSPEFLTADSLGVGTRLERLLRLPRIAGAVGEGAVYAMTPIHCGMSFRLAAPLPAGPSPPSGAALLRRLPPDTPVDRVLLVGCR